MFCPILELICGNSEKGFSYSLIVSRHIYCTKVWQLQPYEAAELKSDTHWLAVLQDAKADKAG